MVSRDSSTVVYTDREGAETFTEQYNMPMASRTVTELTAPLVAEAGGSRISHHF